MTARLPCVCAVVLAAGGSRRAAPLNKLLVPYAGRPLISWAAQAAVNSQVQQVVVVTGHQHQDVATALADLPVTCIYNPHWEHGLASSLRCGLAARLAAAEAVVVCLGDMPRIRPTHINNLIAAFDPTQGVTGCAPHFAGQRGHPVLWGRQFFPDLEALSGDHGGQKLFQRHRAAFRLIAADDDSVLYDVDRLEPETALPAQDFGRTP